MKTTLKRISIPTPDGTEVWDINDFTTKEDLVTINGQIKSAKESVSQHINDVSFITSKTAVKMLKALGVNEDLEVSFKGTHNLDNCTSLIEAILVLDEKLSNL